jgi:hypothetical protein
MLADLLLVPSTPVIDNNSYQQALPNRNRYHSLGMRP